MYTEKLYLHIDNYNKLLKSVINHKSIKIKEVSREVDFVDCEVTFDKLDFLIILILNSK